MNAIFKLLNPSNTISVNRPLAHAVGLSEAVIYSALVAKWHYYSERGMLDSDGFFFSTVADLEESTALTERQQKRCIDKLVSLGLIKCEKRRMPAKRGFYIIENTERLAELIAEGEAKMATVKPQSAKSKVKSRVQQAVPSVCSVSSNVPTKCENKSEQNVVTCPDKMSEQHLYNKTKDNKPNMFNQSIVHNLHKREMADKIGLMGNSQKKCSEYSQSDWEYYTAKLKENISYDILCEQNPYDKSQIDNMLSIMRDVVCSSRNIIRVNGENMPKEVVKSTYLKLDESHIEYVMECLSRNKSDVHNIRSYLITALYNAPSTMDSYYQVRVNHDLWNN